MNPEPSVQFVKTEDILVSNAIGDVASVASWAMIQKCVGREAGERLVLIGVQKCLKRRGSSLPGEPLVPVGRKFA